MLTISDQLKIQTTTNRISPATTLFVDIKLKVIH